MIPAADPPTTGTDYGNRLANLLFHSPKELLLIHPRPTEGQRQLGTGNTGICKRF